MHRYLIALFTALALSHAPARAYEIEPIGVSPSSPIHESMTFAAQDCLAQNGGARPLDCSHYYGEFLDYYAEYGDFDADTHPIPASIRWSDDPQHFFRFGTGLIRAAMQANSCPSIVSAETPLDHRRADLFCQSHYGNLQFFHAMRASEAETRTDTAGRMIDWTRLTFSLASGAVPYTSNFCTFFEGWSGPLSGIMLNGEFQSCGDRIDGQAEGKWVVATPFALVHPRAGFTRRERVGPAAEAAMRTYALGALIHMVQDSYSRSHARRSPVDEASFEPRIICRPIEEFHVYDAENRENHSDADALPEFDTASCGNRDARPIDDPITATAQILWLSQNGGTAEDAAAYIEARVLGVPTEG